MSLNHPQHSRQLTFDLVKQHLLTQNQKSESDHEDPNGHYMCMYRAPDGCKCGAGPLIPDADYQPYFEGRSISSIVGFSDFFGHDIALVFSLQTIHDFWPVHMWPLMLYHVARAYGLTP